MTQVLSDVDNANMLGAIATMPTQLRSGYASASQQLKSIETPSRKPRTLIVCGMGGSGVGSDLLAATCTTHVPVIALKGYDLPVWVSSDDRVVCVSYSGNTAETLACFDDAQKLGCLSAVITSGGQLSERAASHTVPHVNVDGGYQPRAAAGLLFSSLLAVAEWLGIVDGAEALVERAASGAARVIDQHTADESVILGHAQSLQDSLVIIYGAGPSAAIAGRWKAQINENGKVPAYSAAYPELDHNEIVGWMNADAVGARFSLVELIPPKASEAIIARFDITRDLIADEIGSIIRFEPSTANLVEGCFELLVWGDYVSVYLALLRGVDPSPVGSIESLKQQLDGR